jgi:nucleoside-diphosphate-sugar epimerase
MKILITGGAGYIGSIMIPRLLNAGHDVTVIDNFMYNQTSLLDCCGKKNLEIVRGDSRNEKLIKKYLQNVDIILPLACIVGAPACDKNPFEARSINLDAIKLILKNRTKKQKIIFPTTNSGYGIGQKGVYCTEKTPLRPISLYGRLKVNAEKDILRSGNCITLRLATVFGISPRMRFDLLVNDFVYRALMDRSLTLFEAHFKRNYIYIGDVARAFIHCIDNFESMKNETYNVGLSSANLSKWELCEEIKKQIPQFWFTEYNSDEWSKDPDKRNYIVSNDKIEATGFAPKTSLQEGITELIKGYHVIQRNQFSNI